MLAWAEMHREELLANWALVEGGNEPFTIAPLQYLNFGIFSRLKDPADFAGRSGSRKHKSRER